MYGDKRTTALLLADVIAYALFEMQDYLTDVVGLSLTRAAATVSIWVGLSLLLQPLFLFFVVTFLGHIKMVVISSSAYTLGTMLIYLSAPPVLANPCKKYEPECIGKTQTALLYTGMVLIAVGVAGHRVSLVPLLIGQRSMNQRAGPNIIRSIIIALMFQIASIGALVLPLVKHWNLLFGITAIITGIATIFFLIGLCCFEYASFQPNWVEIFSLPKMFTLCMPHMWFTIIAYGIVSSLGRTYFVDQAKHLDRHLGKWEVPTQVLLLAQIWLAKLLYYVTYKLFGARTEIFMAKLFGILCCITAAIMERKRLGIVRSHGLLDKPDQDIPMSVHWLFFQFIFLGCMDMLLEKSMARSFIVDDTGDYDFFMLEDNRWYTDIMSRGASGVGFICSVLFVFIVGKISEKGGDKPSWFQSTSNQSHLDRYYWVLAVLSGVSLVIFSIWCKRQRNVLAND